VPPEADPTAIPLVERFDQATVIGTPEAVPPPPRIEWRFGEEIEEAATGEGGPTLGWRALHGIQDLSLRDGRLVGRTGETPLLTVEGPEDPDPGDSFHALEIEMLVSAGTRLGVSFVGEEELDEEQTVENARERAFLAFNKDLSPGEELRTYRLDSADASFNTSVPLRALRHIVIRPTEASDASFEIASVRVVSLKEHLASVPSGVGWQGLDDVFRETIVARAPERITFSVSLPSRPFLDLSIGTFDHAPVTFEVELEADGRRQRLKRRTVSRAQEWQALPIDLTEHAGRDVTLTLALDSERPGTAGFWGSPVIRNRGGRPRLADASPGREAVVGADEDVPQGVILIIADTLRRDQFQPFGYERPNAPNLTRLAREGALFQDAIAQGSWTKVSVSSIITSLYPTTHGIEDMPDRMPASVTTLAEAYREAGYATFATSSVPFTGRLTNLHQGVEVLHEATSVPEEGHSQSKTSRTYVDRLLDWIEVERDVPFFAFLHVFDPHSPFEPYRPWAAEFMDAEAITQHRQDLETVREFIENDHMKRDGLPKLEEIEKSGIDVERFVAHERAWYDASVKAMDVEIGRLMERLEELGLDERVMIAFTSDHGEEFLEHGRHFHGYNTYGEMLNVPLFLWWPAGIPSGMEVAPTVQGIDVMPTLLEVSRIPVPELAQGQSLLPLLAAGGTAGLGWAPRPAFSERAHAPAAFSDEKVPRSYRSVVSDGWKLIHNVEKPEGVPDFELYDHAKDPLDLHDIAAEHPEVVERLARVLESWHARALEARVETEAADADLSSGEIEKLRALGYL
jgi:arylsulfatase A-like enzyme